MARNSGSGPLEVTANAKINLALEIIGRREDGYHDVATILQTVDLSDVLSLEPADGLTVSCQDPALSGENNIVWQAATRLAERRSIAPDACIRITKRIPVAAGLGGGSADAAAALLGLNRLWGLGLAIESLAEIASGLGADVPFLLNGGTALGTGRGDVLTPLPALPPVDALVVVPAETIEAKTPTLYRSLTPADFSDGTQTRRVANTIGKRSLSSADCLNAFERSARAIFPGLADVWDKVAATTSHSPRLSGAGPALFCLPSSQSEHIRVETALRGTGATAYLVRTKSTPSTGET